MDIAAWLRSLGLERYAPAFQANDIDSELLSKLTADDLIGLGVTSIGHRRKLLEAIAALMPQPAPTDLLAEAASRRGAERRQLTVMFWIWSARPSFRRGSIPRTWARVIRAYQECCAKVIERWGGHVAKYMGDGVLAYFGWPQAHEDEAERAVRAGLEWSRRSRRAERPAAGAPLAARIGIATGLVMVGELIGEGAAQEQAVVGETPNLAARLQALAEPGSVVISQATRRLVGGLFELADLGTAAPQGLCRAGGRLAGDGRGRAEGRFEALHGERLTPLVGREHELGSCSSAGRWPRRRRPGGAALGRAGDRKSRLVRALRERAQRRAHVALRHYCSPTTPTARSIRSSGSWSGRRGFASRRAPEAKLAKLEALLGRATTTGRGGAPVGALLGVPSGRALPALEAQPAGQKQRTLRGAGRAARRPRGASSRCSSCTRTCTGSIRRRWSSSTAGRARPAAAGARGAHLPAGVPAALDRSCARHRADA